MDLDEAQLTAQDAMDKAVEYLKNELRGVRTGRATTSLVDYIKVDYYGSPTDLRSLALVTVPESSQILIKPFDASSLQACVKAIQTAGLGLNPVAEGKQIRVSIPPLTGDRRQQLVGSVKQMGEHAKVTLRNARRDANKHIEQASKDKTLHLSEDAVEEAKTEVQELLKKYEKQVDDLIAAKKQEIEEL